MTRSVKTNDFVVSLRALEHDGRMPVRRSALLPEIAVSTAWVPEGAEVSADLVLEAVHGGVLASGTVSVPWMAECGRCLEMARGTVFAEVRELFEEGGGEQDMTYPLGEESVDLEPMVREQCLLGLPLRPLCKPDCRGLCSHCGANLNEGPCGCPPERDERWAALDVFRED